MCQPSSKRGSVGRAPLLTATLPSAGRGGWAVGRSQGPGQRGQTPGGGNGGRHSSGTSSTYAGQRAGRQTGRGAGGRAETIRAGTHLSPARLVTPVQCSSRWHPWRRSAPPRRRGAAPGAGRPGSDLGPTQQLRCCCRSGCWRRWCCCPCRGRAGKWRRIGGSSPGGGAKSNQSGPGDEAVGVAPSCGRPPHRSWWWWVWPRGEGGVGWVCGVGVGGLGGGLLRVR